MDQTNPLRPVVQAWLQAVVRAGERKEQRFGPEARDGMRFFSGPYDFFFKEMARDRYFGPNDGGGHGDGMVVTVNKVAEMVQIFGPVLYHKNPVRQVTPRTQTLPPPELYGQPTDPAAAQAYFADLNAAKLAYTVDKFKSEMFRQVLDSNAQAYDMKSHSRRAIDEAIIKGLSTLWPDVSRTPDGKRQGVRTVYDSVDNLYLDPAAKCLDDCRYTIRRVIQPAWQVERDFRLPPGSVKPTVIGPDSWAKDGLSESQMQQKDTVVWYQVFSNMGIGGRFPGVAASADERAYYELFGEHCYLAVTAGCDYPLNLPPELLQGQAGIVRGVWASQWPTPTWMDGNLPFVPVHFHEIPGDVWPMSHLSPAMGELKFLVWAYAKIAAKIKTTCRDFIAVSDAADKAVRQAIEEGEDLTVLNISGVAGKALNEMVQFLQHPTWNPDIWKVIEAVSEQFDRRTGLTELAYGVSSRQLRSAAEADLKAQSLAVRPDDMANKVEDAMSAAARRELIACRWHLTGADVAPILGPTGPRWWDLLVTQADPADVFLGLDCRVEAGSARKPNKEGMIDAMEKAMQSLFQPFYQYGAVSGDVDPVNALIQDYVKALDLGEPDRFRLRPLPPPPVEAPGKPAPQGSPA